MKYVTRTEKIMRRYWWPHPIYQEARRYQYKCYTSWKPWVNIVVDYRYFINNVEVNIYGKPLK